MKKFGEKFEEYVPVEIDHISVSDTDHGREAVSYEPFDLMKLKKKSAPMSRAELEAELKKHVIEVAPVANVYQIPPDQQDLSDSVKRTLSWFNYYVVELGLNVMVGREYKIPELLFQVALRGDTEGIDVVAYDIAPKDETKYTNLLSGNVKINLGVTTFLKFIPAPFGEHISDLLHIDINPWEFKWGIDRYMIDACGENNCDVYWKIYETNVVQGFNPTMIIRVKKNVSEISAGITCIYKLKTGWCTVTPKIESREREVALWPMY